MENFTKIRFFVGPVRKRGLSQNDFAKAKIKLYLRDNSGISEDYIIYQAGLSGEQIPLAMETKSSIPNFGSRNSEVEIMMRCIKNQVKSISVLIEEETVEDTWFSYLKEDFHKIPKGTVVVVVETSFGVIYYLLETVFYSPLFGLKVSQRQTLIPQAHIIYGDSNWQSTAASMAGNVTKALTKKYLVKEGASAFVNSIGGIIAGGLASMAVDGILNLLFPSDNPDIFDYLDDIKEIIHQEIQGDTVIKISGAMQEIIREINSDYEKRRHDNTPLSNVGKYTDLYKYLDGYITNLTTGGAEGVMGTLMTQGYQQVGFPAFLFGASLHLSLMQELANVYYYKQPDDYNDFIEPGDGTIAKWTQTYMNWLSDSWQAVSKARRDDITIDLYNPFETDLYIVTVYDTGNDVAEFSAQSKDSSIKQVLQAEAADYITYYYFPFVLDILSYGFGYPATIYQTWKRLIQNPMGDNQQDWPPPDTLTTPSESRFILLTANSDTLNPGDSVYHY